ncbi:hypothetical protein [Streptomyces sp. KR55]
MTSGAPADAEDNGVAGAAEAAGWWKRSPNAAGVPHPMARASRR